MKTYKQFQENVASLVLRKGSKFLLPALMTGIGAAGTLYQATKGDGESNFEKLRKMREKGEGKDLEQQTKKNAKKRSTREKIKNALVDASLNYRKGLSAGKEVESTSSTGRISSTSASDEFRKKEGGKSPAQIARELIQKQREQYRKERERNRKNELP